MSEFKIKGNRMTMNELMVNIMAVWEQSTSVDRFDWYAEALEFASTEMEGLPIAKAVGIVSALSPMKTWKENKRIATLFAQGVRTGLHTGMFIGKAEDILHSDGSDEAILAILNGKKITSFYMNIRYPHCDKHVTIDRHAISIALGYSMTDEKATVTPKQYETLREAFKLTASEIGISPVLLQSATWVTWRKLKKVEPVPQFSEDEMF